MSMAFYMLGAACVLAGAFTVEMSLLWMGAAMYVFGIYFRVQELR